jgi:hypothetical protein
MGFETAWHATGFVRCDHLGGLSDLGSFVFDTFGTLPNLGGTQTGVFTQRRVLARPGETIDGIHLLTAFTARISHFDREAFSGSYSNAGIAEEF